MPWKIWKWKIHWQIVVAIVLGVSIGRVFQVGLDGENKLGLSLDDKGTVTDVEFFHDGGLKVGDVITAPENLDTVVADADQGTKIELEVKKGEITRSVRASVYSTRQLAVAPFDFIAELFLRLLRMLVVPLIITSLISGVCSLGDVRTLGRIGGKTIAFYTLTSLLAILVGLLFVNVIAPGDGADLQFREAVDQSKFSSDESFVGIFLRMVPENIFSAMIDTGAILQVIFFCLLFGTFVTQVGGKHGQFLKDFFEASFEVMMKLAQFVLRFIPLGVLALLVRVVGNTGLEIFKPLLVFMGTVLLTLVFHAFVTLPLILKFFAGVRPLDWFRAVTPALMTAFSTSSSSITLPETMRSVQERGKVSNKTSSFVLPLGATINMDGTALYECVGVLFLAQYYASTGHFELTVAAQLTVVLTALLASVGAAGIPSAGLVMMTTILSALGLPLEGVALLLAVDRPLDMLRTVVNIWSDTTCTAVIAVSEGETGIAGTGPPGGPIETPKSDGPPASAET